MNQIVKKISLTLVVAALASGTLMAQTKGRTVQQPGKVTILPHFSNVQVPFRAEEPDSIDANIVVAKNLGPTGSTYVVDNGYLVTGASDVTFGGPYSVGVQFTPTVNCHAKVLSAAITYYEGTKQVRLGIYDNNGAGGVGALLQDGATANIPNFGSCCQLAKVTLSGTGRLSPQDMPTSWSLQLTRRMVGSCGILFLRLVVEQPMDSPSTVLLVADGIRSGRMLCCVPDPRHKSLIDLS